MSDTTDLDDLLRRVEEGDGAAWAEVVRRFDGLVRARVRASGLPVADRGDAVQATWLRFGESVGQLRVAAGLPGWLSTVARRECLAILRRRPTRSLDVTGEPVDPSPQPDDHVIRAETVAAVREALDLLSPKRRLLLAALFHDEAPYATISRLHGIPVGGIGPTRRRALDALRVVLEETAAQRRAGGASSGPTSLLR